MDDDPARLEYRPLRNRLTLLLEVSAQLLLSAGATGAASAMVTKSGPIAVTAASAVALLWARACLRTKLVLSSDSIVITNRWREHLIALSSIDRFEPRHATRGLFGAGGKSYPVIAAVLRAQGGEIRIDVTASADRTERRRAVDLMRAYGVDFTNVSSYLAGYV